MASRPSSAYMGHATSGGEWSIQPHWDDIFGTESQGTGGAALTYAQFRDTPLNLYSFRTGQTDSLHLRYQFPHSWDRESEVRFHLHGVPLTDPSGSATVQWSGSYVWAPIGEEIGANASWTPFTLASTVTTAQLNTHQLYSFFSTTPPAGTLESSILLIYLSRLGADPSDDYSGNVGVLSIDCHFQRIKFGTISEIPTP